MKLYLAGVHAMMLGLSGPSCHDSVTVTASIESDMIHSQLLADLFATDCALNTPMLNDLGFARRQIVRRTDLRGIRSAQYTGENRRLRRTGISLAVRGDVSFVLVDKYER